MTEIKVLSKSSEEEINKRKDFFNKYKNSPIPDNELLDNLGLYIKRQSLSRILFMHELYKKIINIHGVIIEFGVRWGQNLSLFTSFRGIYEPYNFNRKIIGFDTFTGIPEIDNKDGDFITKDSYSVTEGYHDYLNEVLLYHESENPLSHIKKHELVKGDAIFTFEDYLLKHPETIVALAYFDFDVYKPTLTCLNHIKDRVTKGSIIAFDELNCAEFPGETLALKEAFGLNKYSIKRSPLAPLCSYITIE